MISATTWVPRGFASEFPETYVLDDEEMERITEMANLHLGNAKEELSKVKKTDLQDTEEIDDDLKEFDLEHYDDVETDAQGEPITIFPGLAGSGVNYVHGDNEEDEEGEEMDTGDYLTLPTEAEQSEDKKELQIYPTDNLVLATRTEDEVSYLDVYVYDDGAGAPEGAEEEDADKRDPDVAKGMVREGNLYVHHDLMLPNFPLCVEWLSVIPGEPVDETNTGNFAAVGTLDPTVEIWNLDCIDKAFPDAILGEEPSDSQLKKKKKKKSKKKISKERHTDAVLSISHNKHFRNVLATTSVDTTVKLWDLSSLGVARSIEELHHGKTVSGSQWHPADGSILLTSGYDSKCAISDVRIENVQEMAKYYSVGESEEVESVAWGHETYFYAGTDQGNVYYFDARQETKPVWTLHAHDSGISSLAPNSGINSMLVTGAMGDKQLKLWKTAPSPSMVISRDFDCGNVLTASFATDVEVAGDLVVGGSSTGLKLWDVFSNRFVRNSFKSELKQLQNKAREEAQNTGNASRLARKYLRDSEVVIAAEEGDDEDDDDEE